MAIYKYHWNFITILAAKVGVGIYIHRIPGKAGAAGEFGEAFFDDLAEMTPFSRVEKHLVGFRHGRIVYEWRTVRSNYRELRVA